MGKINWKPIGNRIIIKPLYKREKTKGGLFIPIRSQSEKQEGIVIRVSDEVDEVKESEKVFYNYQSGGMFYYDNEKYRIIDMDQVKGVIEDDLD